MILGLKKKAVQAEISADLYYLAVGNSAQVTEHAGNVFAEIEAADIAENDLLDDSGNDVDSVNSDNMADESALVVVADKIHSHTSNLDDPSTLDLDMRVESGTCNVCSAPCSSCMHRMAVAGEPNVDCGSSDNKYVRKEIDSFSFIDIKLRPHDDLQTAASETSNLLSGSSSNDSYSENAESKTTIRNPSTYDSSEDVDMLPEASTVEEDKFLHKDISVEGHEMPCNYTGAAILHSELDGGYRMSRCHRNSDSSMSGTRDGNDVGLDHSLEQAKRDASCSSSQTFKFNTKETKMAIQVEDTCESEGYGVEGDRVSRRMLNTYHREFLHNKTLSPLNVGFSSLSDSTQKNSPVKLNSTSPCQSDHISSHSADGCNDLEANQPSQFQGASHECILVKEGSPCHRLLPASCDHGQKIHSFPDIGAGKETNIRISSPLGELKNVDPCLESAAAIGTCASSLHESGMQLQLVLPGQTSESDNILFDVKVCDICGDAGREELLATCSRCIDGAEHTYCMKIMLTKVPEGDWLCEECQLKEEVETRDLKSAEMVCGASNEQSLNKKIQNLGSYANTENCPRFYSQSTDTEASKSSKRACTPIKEMQIRTPRKRHMHHIDVASPTKKKITEPTDEHSKLVSPRIAAVFSRENPIKNFNVADVKRMGISSSLDYQSANNARNLSRSPALDSRENSFKSFHITELKRASSASFSEGLVTNSSPTFTRSHTLDSKYVQREHSSVALSRQVSLKKNVEQKVKKLSEDVPQKLTRESTSGNTKMMTLVKTFNKSASFKSVSSDYHDDESATKSQSLKSPQAENPKGVKQVKERIVPERATSTVVVVDSVVPSIKRKYIPKMDLKIAPHSRDSTNKLETASLGNSKGFAKENRLVHKELKKQLSFQNKSSVSVDTGNRNIVESQKSEDIHVNSTSVSIFSKDAGGVATCSESLSSDSHPVSLNEKTKDSYSKSRLATSGVIHESDHAKLREANHSADSCQKARLPSSSAKLSADVSSKDGTNKRNKWRDAIKATMCRTIDISESRLCSTTNAIVSNQIGSQKPPADVSLEDGTRKRIKLMDAPKIATHSSKKIRKVDKCDFRLLSNNEVCEGSFRCSFPIISQKNLPIEDAHIVKRALDNNDTVNSRTNSIDNQSKHLMESSSLHVGDLNGNLAALDETNENNLTQILPNDSSLQTTIVRSLAMPEHDFIWWGGFEIIRIGRLPEVVDGIQAHLSNFASPKVHEVSCQFPSKIQLEEVPRVSLWPSQFQETGPEENNIALYFFAKDSKSYEKSYLKLLETALKSDLAFKGSINELEILIFPSSILPESSQRWNTLFFLWGVFRVRELDSSKPHTDLHDNPYESKMPSKSHVQDISSHACEESTLLKNDSQQNLLKELNSIDESCADKKVEFDSVVDFHGTSSASLDNDNHETKDFSIKTSLCKAAAETESKELPDEFPCYRTELGHTNNEVDDGKITHIHATSEQQKLTRFLSGNSVPSGFGQEGNASREMMMEEKNSVKTEPLPEEKIKEVDSLNWDSKPYLKHTHPWSVRLHGERLESIKANEWQDEKGVPMEEEPKHKRIQYDEESHTSASYGEDQNMGYRLPSNVQPSLTSYFEEKQNGGSVNYSHAMTESSHCIERCFFPLDFCSDRREMENFRYFLPPVDEDTPESNAPDLELALGGKKPFPKKETFQPFYPLVYDGRLDKLSDSTVTNHDDDDISESLSLSLALTGMERKRAPVKRQDPPGVSTSLILFGGFSGT
ncbi:hypothetical protein ZIOFF_039936 [Zingiber officinale]|uniref:Zinc finger PHD-type domain-containing protein n=2 Tax=Zingiber officinale TaxID=94328 RepID=A0A8J5GA95_ZINOF|nr:hypothetical protein ZIOFF_039936 [Zingiber officinale]